MIERITKMAADLMENGANGATGATLIVSALLAILTIAIFGARLRTTKEDNNE
jgi:hypothetical protein